MFWILVKKKKQIRRKNEFITFDRLRLRILRRYSVLSALMMDSVMLSEPLVIREIISLHTRHNNPKFNHENTIGSENLKSYPALAVFGDQI